MCQELLVEIEAASNTTAQPVAIQTVSGGRYPGLDERGAISAVPDAHSAARGEQPWTAAVAGDFPCLHRYWLHVHE